MEHSLVLLRSYIEIEPSTKKLRSTSRSGSGGDIEFFESPPPPSRDFFQNVFFSEESRQCPAKPRDRVGWCECCIVFGRRHLSSHFDHLLPQGDHELLRALLEFANVGEVTHHPCAVTRLKLQLSLLLPVAGEAIAMVPERMAKYQCPWPTGHYGEKGCRPAPLWCRCRSWRRDRRIARRGAVPDRATCFQTTGGQAQSPPDRVPTASRVAHG